MLCCCLYGVNMCCVAVCMYAICMPYVVVCIVCVELYVFCAACVTCRPVSICLYNYKLDCYDVS